jgi:thiol-disulfide isomerase/thioredoxin
MEGTSVDVFTVLDQEGKKIDFPPGPAQKRVVIFWASWCAPCKIELQRYQSSLDSGSLPPGSVQTVAIWDEPATVKSFIQSKGYTFPVYFSSDPNILKAYQVQATPTVALLDEANNIYWVSSGISPLGIYRAENFINDSK